MSRVLFETFSAAVALLDGAAALCTAATGAVYALAWLVTLPVVGLGRLCLALSRRITQGSHHGTPAP